MHFSRQMGVFMKAGIPIMEALEVIQLETTEKLMKKVIAEMVDDASCRRHICGGGILASRSLSQFLCRHP